MIDPILVALFWGFVVGMTLGSKFEAMLWRGKGDHEYMNRIESGGRLYVVKREESP